MGAGLRRGPAPPAGRRAREVSAPRVSIVLPTRNGAATLPAVLEPFAPARGLTVEGVPSFLVSRRHGRTASWSRRSADQHRSGLRSWVDTISASSRRERAGHPAGTGALPTSDTWLAALRLLADVDWPAPQAARPDASATARDYLDRWILRPRRANRRSRGQRRLDARADGEARAARSTALTRASAIGLGRISVQRRRRRRRHQWAGRAVSRLNWRMCVGASDPFHDRSARYEFARTSTAPPSRELFRCARFRRCASGSRHRLIARTSLAPPAPVGEPSPGVRGRLGSIWALSAVRGWKPIGQNGLMRILEVVHGFPAASGAAPSYAPRAHARALRRGGDGCSSSLASGTRRARYDRTEARDGLRVVRPTTRSAAPEPSTRHAEQGIGAIASGDRRIRATGGASITWPASRRPSFGRLPSVGFKACSPFTTTG